MKPECFNAVNVTLQGFACGWSRTNKLPEGELHLGLVGRAATHELRFHFQVLQLQIENLLLQGLLEPGAPLLVRAQVGDGEADGETQHGCADRQRHVAVGGSVAVVKKHLCEGLVLFEKVKAISVIGCNVFLQLCPIIMTCF